jgi:LPXTG-site transpeptidase (sortase) family protein
MIGNLQFGDTIIVHAYGMVYTYEVRENRSISPNNTSVLKHEDESWLTLITCKSYDKETNTYYRRTAVRAVLVRVTEEKQAPRGGR